MSYTNFFTGNFTTDQAAGAAGTPVAGIIPQTGNILSTSGNRLHLTAGAGAASYYQDQNYIPGSNAQTDQIARVRIPANPPTNFSVGVATRLRLLDGGTRTAQYQAGFNENHGGVPSLYLYWTDSSTAFNPLIFPVQPNPVYNRTHSYILSLKADGTLPTTLTLTLYDETTSQTVFSQVVTDSTNTSVAPLQSAGYAAISNATLFGQPGGTFETDLFEVDLQISVPPLVVPPPTLTSRTSTTNTLNLAPTGGTAPYSVAWHKKAKDFAYTPSGGTLLSGITGLTPTIPAVAGELAMYKAVVTDSSTPTKTVTTDFLMVETVRPSRGALPAIATVYRNPIVFPVGDSITASGALALAIRAYLLAHGAQSVIIGNAGFQGTTWVNWRPDSTSQDIWNGCVNPLTGNTYQSEYGGTIPGSNSLAKGLRILDDLIAANPGRPVIIPMMLGMNDQLQGIDPAVSLAAAQQVIAAFSTRGRVLINGLTWAYLAGNGPTRSHATAALGLRDSVKALANNTTTFSGYDDYYYDLSAGTFANHFYDASTQEIFDSKNFDVVHIATAGDDLVGAVQGEAIVRKMIAQGDETPPGPPTLTLTAGNGQITLHATGPVDTDLSAIRFFRAPGVEIGSPVSCAPGATVDKVVASLTNGQEYAFWAFTVDGVGNQSAASEVVFGTPKAPPVANTFELNLSYGFNDEPLAGTFQFDIQSLLQGRNRFPVFVGNAIQDLQRSFTFDATEEGPNLVNLAVLDGNASWRVRTPDNNELFLKPQLAGAEVQFKEAIVGYPS